MGDLAGKICLVTGATAGIGRVAAYQLAGMGATVVGVGRNFARCESTCAEIRASTGNPNVEYIVSDLSEQAQIRNLAEKFLGKYDRLGVLVNNAGAFFFRRQESSEGIEKTFALNHLNYFLLTNLLLDRIIASEPARIVNVSSGMHQGAEINFDDLEMKRRYSGLKAYAQSKLANVLFTYELSRRLEGRRVTTNAMTPGFVATQIGQNNGLVIRLIVKASHLFGAKSPEEGARTILYLATSPEVEGLTGAYYVDCQARRSSPVSYDIDVAKRLWEISDSMTG
jgi:NAD(P)-dependent dehydrogenase (short-subunit alcohol dehydrogenase family)